MDNTWHKLDVTSDLWSRSFIYIDIAFYQYAVAILAHVQLEPGDIGICNVVSNDLNCLYSSSHRETIYPFWLQNG